MSWMPPCPCPPAAVFGGSPSRSSMDAGEPRRSSALSSVPMLRSAALGAVRSSLSGAGPGGSFALRPPPQPLITRDEVGDWGWLQRLGGSTGGPDKSACSALAGHAGCTPLFPPPQLRRNAVRGAFTACIVFLDFMVRGLWWGPVLGFETLVCRLPRAALGRALRPRARRSAAAHHGRCASFFPPQTNPQVMLVAMTFNLGLIISATLGYGLGALAFGELPWVEGARRGLRRGTHAAAVGGGA